MQSDEDKGHVPAQGETWHLAGAGGGRAVSRLEIAIQGVPAFEFKLTPEQYQLLLDLSRLHYDARCRQAEKEFLGRWARTEIVRATFDEVGICSKILELAGYLPDKAKHAIAAGMAIPFSRAQCRANELWKEWRADAHAGAAP